MVFCERLLLYVMEQSECIPHIVDDSERYEFTALKSRPLSRLDGVKETGSNRLDVHRSMNVVFRPIRNRDFV
jgi:hypothetical protein